MSETLEAKLVGSPTAPLHPNRITALGGAVTLAGLGMLFFESTRYAAPCVFATGYIGGDWFDGYYARKFGLQTKEGSKLDPLFDKIKNVASGVYMLADDLFSNTALATGILANFMIDYDSQKQRGPLLEQLKESGKAIWSPETCEKDVETKSSTRANDFGKFKTGIQTGVNITAICKAAYLQELCSPALFIDVNQGLNYLMAGALVTSAYLGYKGVQERLSQ